MTTIVCLKDRHEIAISLQLNIYPVCDLALCGFERYPVSVYPNNCYFDSFELNKPILVFPWRLAQYMLDTILMSLGWSGTIPD